jgi:hypothetical protein
VAGYEGEQDKWSVAYPVPTCCITDTEIVKPSQEVLLDSFHGCHGLENLRVAKRSVRSNDNQIEKADRADCTQGLQRRGSTRHWGLKEKAGSVCERGGLNERD